ncbi:MAG: riboflavin synthase [Candidatus Ancaeobacter aquaticus]|nr:riboflavin synthase [Candidatus Ancaeobacter aquaticus]
MFTGIIEEIGLIKAITKKSDICLFEIAAKKVLEGTKIGDSISVNGVCLTVKKMTTRSFQAELLAETRSRTTLSLCKKDSRVNLERALTLSKPIGGHIVAGHVDGMGTIKRKVSRLKDLIFEIGCEKKIIKYIVEKGSIAVNGISLTVCDVSVQSFTVHIIKQTLNNTTLSDVSNGQKVNIETDIISKYVERLCPQKKYDKIDSDFLRKSGFTQ